MKYPFDGMMNLCRWCKCETISCWGSFAGFCHRWQRSFKKVGPVPLAIKGWISHIFCSDLSATWQRPKRQSWIRCHASDACSSLNQSNMPHLTAPLQPANYVPHGTICLLTFYPPQKKTTTPSSNQTESTQATMKIPPNHSFNMNIIVNMCFCSTFFTIKKSLDPALNL